jgi:stalled ribosome alternative rescue factor ArfA
MGQKDRVKHKRRFCKIAGCTKIVKSQGLCQRHGAKTRKCKVDGCEKQAQGNFDGMCKLHFKMTKTQLIAEPVNPQDVSPEPEGESVYDRILPESIGWNDPDEPMPLIKHLKEGFDKVKPRGWHRNEERRARGLVPISNPAIQLEAWERELVWLETCILSGAPHASFRHLARGWGRDKGFHMVLTQFICERRGDVERKKRGRGDYTRKERRPPVELAPSGEELHHIMELDQVDFDVLHTFVGHGEIPAEVCEDPTVNFTNIPNFANLGKRVRPSRPLHSHHQAHSALDDVFHHHHHAHMHHSGGYQEHHPLHHPHAIHPSLVTTTGVHASPSHAVHASPILLQHPMQHSVAQHLPKHPPVLGPHSRVITHEALVVEAQATPPAPPPSMFDPGESV